MLQSLSFQILHHDVGLTLMLTHIMDGADVGMVQRRGGPGFTLESFQCLAVLRQLVRKELQGHMPAQASVFGFVNDTHSSATELLYDFVMSDRVADHVLFTHHSGTANANNTLPRHSAPEAIARVDINHPPDRCGAGRIQRSSPRRGLRLSFRIPARYRNPR